MKNGITLWELISNHNSKIDQEIGRLRQKIEDNEREREAILASVSQSES